MKQFQILAATRDGFGTVMETTGGPPLTRAFAGASATVEEDASFKRYGFRAVHGYAAVEIGKGMLSAEEGGLTWKGSFTSAHAWTGDAEAVRLATFEHLQRGSAEVRIADLSRPLVEVDVDLYDGAAGSTR